MTSTKLPVFPSTTKPSSVADTLDFHIQHNPDQPYFAFSSNETVTTISHLEFGRACHRIAHAIRPNCEGPDGQVVAIVALVDTVLYQAVNVGLMRAGCVPFPISPRNSAAAIVHLLMSSSCHRLVSTQETLGDLLNDVRTELTQSHPDYQLSIEEIPSLSVAYPYLGSESADKHFKPYPILRHGSLTELALLVHSSGSTGFPKPIPQTHLALWEWGQVLSTVREHVPRLRIGGMSLPPFHTLGLAAQILCPLFGLVCVTLFPPTVISPQNQPLLPTPDNVLDHLRMTGSNSILTIPAIFSGWIQRKDSVDILREFIFVGFGGGPLSKKLGDYFIQQGVNLFSLYGASETGPTTSIRTDRTPNQDWDWMRFSDRVCLRWVAQGDGTYEAHFLTSETHHPSVINTTDSKGYATSDLFEKHPTKEGLWRISGRIDDVIVHSSGEKTVPAPMEGVMLSSPLIRGVTMFGRQHDQAGVLVEPSSKLETQIDGPEQLAEIRNILWPIIEEANHNAPAFSRIYKEMVLITSKDKPLPRTPKGTVIRKAALALYQEEIQNLYKTIESNSGDGAVTPPENWSRNTLVEWLVQQSSDIQSGREMLASKDIFEQGFDSLSATFLRLRVTGALRHSENQRLSISLPSNIIYTYPTINLMSEFLTQFVTNSGSANLSRTPQDNIEEMIAKYSKGLDIPLAAPVVDRQTKEAHTVLITGTTGNLGSDILALLLGDERVAGVYAINRRSTSQTMLSRHESRFADKGLDVALLQSKKLHLLEGDTAQEQFGIDLKLYEELLETATMIIHVAWRLDFNLTLASFEPNVRGTRNLIDFARCCHRSSSLRFVFTSSISTAQSWDPKKGPYPEEMIEDSSYAIGGGYGEGKYVAEKILANSGLQATSVRLGQISGAQNGAWSTSDWLPILIKSSLALNAVPSAAGVVSWIPMDVAAKIVLDIAFHQGQHVPALNLVHPRPVTWNSMMKQILHSLERIRGVQPNSIQMIPFQEWLTRLEMLSGSANGKQLKLEKIPAIKLIDFFRNMAKGDTRITEEKNYDSESGGLANLSLEKIQKTSETIRSLDCLTEDDSENWIKYWNDRNFFD